MCFKVCSICGIEVMLRNRRNLSFCCRITGMVIDWVMEYDFEFHTHEYTELPARARIDDAPIALHQWMSAMVAAIPWNSMTYLSEL